MEDYNILPWATILEESKERQKQIKRENRLKAITTTLYIMLIATCITAISLSICAVTNNDYKRSESGQIY